MTSRVFDNRKFGPVFLPIYSDSKMWNEDKRGSVVGSGNSNSMDTQWNGEVSAHWLLRAEFHIMEANEDGAEVLREDLFSEYEYEYSGICNTL